MPGRRVELQKSVRCCVECNVKKCEEKRPEINKEPLAENERCLRSKRFDDEGGSWIEEVDNDRFEDDDERRSDIFRDYLGEWGFVVLFNILELVK